MSIEVAGPVAYLSESGSAVYFGRAGADAGTFQSKGTVSIVKQFQNLIGVALWGEDNRFSQNIEQQMAYCGVGKAGLDWKARALYASGILPGKNKRL